MATSDELKKGINKVDEKTHELIMEFHSHYEEYVKLKPEDRNRKDDIFQAWVIQKIAGLQVSLLEIAERINSLLKTMHTH